MDKEEAVQIYKEAMTIAHRYETELGATRSEAVQFAMSDVGRDKFTEACGVFGKMSAGKHRKNRRGLKPTYQRVLNGLEDDKAKKEAIASTESGSGGDLYRTIVTGLYERGIKTIPGDLVMMQLFSVMRPELHPSKSTFAGIRYRLELHGWSFELHDGVYYQVDFVQKKLDERHDQIAGFMRKMAEMQRELDKLSRGE